MIADDEVQALVDKITAGELDKYIVDLDGSDFGLYIPAYAEGNSIKMMMSGYSQTERNLKVSVSKKLTDELLDAKQVAWVGGQVDKDSKCRHGGTSTCKHCTTHSGNCRHCTSHKDARSGDLIAPQLDYDGAIQELEFKKHLLEPLAADQFGLTLLHGHSKEFMFTKLPEGMISVISDGTTNFRKEEDVLSDPTFVPNVWRVIDGKLRVAGGYSDKSDDAD